MENPWKKYALKGSYTVEAAIIFPLILLFLVTVVELAVENYQAVENTVLQCEKMEAENPLQTVRRLLSGKELVEEITCR